MQLNDKAVLVLGANGAFGSSIAEKLIARGAKVYGTARSQESASRLPSRIAQGLLLDLENPDSIQALALYLQQSGTVLDGVINATGRVGFGTIETTSAADADRLMQINHLGPAAFFTAVLPLLKQAADADPSAEKFILSISGVVAEKVFPGMAAYTASKTAHSAWLRGLELEARRSRIRVFDARPGHTESGLATRPLFGTAPAFGIGMTVDAVTETMIRAIETDNNQLGSEAFTA